jgi:carbonic anhydrase
MIFEYISVPKDELEVIYDQGLVRIRPTSSDKSFGDLQTADGNQIYSAKEIVFHTPGEHRMNHKEMDFEI